MTLTRVFSVVSVVIMLAASCAAQQAASNKVPDTRPGQFVTEWLGMCQAPNLQQMTKWSAEYYSERVLQHDTAENLAKSDFRDCSDNGGYRLAEVTESKPDRIDVLAVGNKTDVWIRLVLLLDKRGKIDSARVLPASPPESALPKDLSDAAVKVDISSYADRLGNVGLFSGSVMLARGTQSIVMRSEGYADRRSKTPFTPSSQFTIGSMGKMFTSTAIGQLVDQGKISYDDVVGKFFPDYSNKTVRERVTVAMLLSHTSGMGDFLSKRTSRMMKHGVKRAAEFMPLYDKDEPRFEPGKSWAYSNAGLALAGAIVEKVSGDDYPNYLRKHIFDPAGMKDSDPNNIPTQYPHLVVPYTHLSESGETADWHEAEHDIGSPAGGAVSSTEDLIRFAYALRSGKLVSKATFERMIQPHGKTPWGASYGYAMEIDDVYGRTIVGHGGGFPGVSSHLYIVLDSPYTLVVLANQDPPAAELIGERARAIVAEKAKQGK